VRAKTVLVRSKERGPLTNRVYPSKAAKQRSDRINVQGKGIDYQPHPIASDKGVKDS
jgi:hypothetical protein